MNQEKLIKEVIFIKPITKTSLELALNGNNFFKIIKKREGNIIEINTPNPIPNIKETFTFFIKCTEEEFKRIKGAGIYRLTETKEIVKY